MEKKVRHVKYGILKVRHHEKELINKYVSKQNQEDSF